VLGDQVVNGDQIRYVLAFDNGYYTTRDTIVKYYGIPVVVFSDAIPNLEKWTGGWGLYGMFPYSAPYSMADSPSGNYTNNANNSTTLTQSVSLANASVAVLNFHARWRIEPGYDYVQLKISTNNGSTWTPIAGKYTHPGSSNQTPGPVYDGIVNSWVREEINLSQYAGQNIKLRFTLRSDGGTVADGYFFDDLAITIIDVTTGLQNPEPASGYFISEPKPNPANDKTLVSYSLPVNSGNACIILTDLSGKQLQRIPVSGRDGDLEVNTSQLRPGMYLLTLLVDAQKQVARKLIRQ
jgi:hypothetical protein